MEAKMKAKEKISPETCVKNCKCMMADMMEKMKPSLEDYKKMSEE